MEFEWRYLSVRDLEVRDIEFIVGYWTNLDAKDLERMKIDPAKLPEPALFKKKLIDLRKISRDQRMSDSLIWEVDGRAVGFSSLKNIRRGDCGEIHLHLVDAGMRGKGLGPRLLVLSMKEFAGRYDLKTIICQPAASNPHPNGVLRKLGVPPTKTYRTCPSDVVSGMRSKSL